MKTDLSLITALKLTSEIYGRQMSDAAAAMLLADLEDYPVPAVIAALSRCRRELRTFPTLADIVARIDDGRPGPEEAWAMVPKDEMTSVVWTEEMATAFGTIRDLAAEDLIAARVAFKEVYSRLLADSRLNHVPVRWTASLGHEKSGREVALREAVTKGRLEIEHALKLIPELEYTPDTRLRQLIGRIGLPMPKEPERE